MVGLLYHCLSELRIEEDKKEVYMYTAISYIVLAARDGLLGDGSWEANIEFLHSINEECPLTDCECHYEEGGSKEVLECQCTSCVEPIEEDYPW
jgi:hypothetical protein